MNPQEENSLVQAFERLGATPEGARTMATQLIKRAKQLAIENNTSELAELKKLLETVTHGSQGMLKPSKQADFE